jgi:hypothetical protein
LEVGQNIVVFGPNIKHLTEGIYRIGCHVLLPGSRIGCKIGFLRATFDQLNFFVNRVGVISYIAHDPTELTGNVASDKLHKDLGGYCHVSFLAEGNNFVPQAWKKKDGGWARMNKLPKPEIQDIRKGVATGRNKRGVTGVLKMVHDARRTGSGGAKG